MSIDTEVPTEVPVAEAEKKAQELFKYSEWVHVGDGAAECEHAQDGECKEEGHFHAWCRLPNPFQVRDITEKARAAAARYRRLLRDPASDEHIVLESELDELRDADPDALVAEVIDRDFAEDYDAAVREVAEIEDPSYTPTGEEGEEIPKLYAHIDQDREEWNRQRVLPEDQRTEDFKLLEETAARYGRDIEVAMQRLREPRREVLLQEDPEKLVDRIRRDRIEQRATEVYLHNYNTWQWYVCTLRPVKKGTPSERVFKDLTQMRMNTPSEVILALRETFDSLENNLAANRRGKGS